ncbi:MAG: purine-binding chemotaxis protein CheW [Sphingomonadales bacterium]|jgi:purine-binding chemotaxis protein CheW|nr:purine-binding chemotaxis protein CheW [Sphingomonadales bacterium]
MNRLLLIVTIAGERVALPASAIEAVVEIESLTPVPGAAPHVAGLSALRSRVVTVIDSHASLGLSRFGPARDAVLAVVDGHPYALLVDAVEDVVEAAAEPQPLRAAASPGWARVARSAVEAEGDLLLLLDVPAMIAGPAAQASA